MASPLGFSSHAGSRRLPRCCKDSLMPTQSELSKISVIRYHCLRLTYGAHDLLSMSWLISHIVISTVARRTRLLQELPCIAFSASISSGIYSFRQTSLPPAAASYAGSLASIHHAGPQGSGLSPKSPKKAPGGKAFKPEATDPPRSPEPEVFRPHPNNK